MQNKLVTKCAYLPRMVGIKCHSSPNADYTFQSVSSRLTKNKRHQNSELIELHKEAENTITMYLISTNWAMRNPFQFDFEMSSVQKY